MNLIELIFYKGKKERKKERKKFLLAISSYNERKNKIETRMLRIQK